MKAALAELLHNPLLWQGDRLAREDAVASGFAALDRELPGGGWPQASLTELLLDHQGIGELRLVLPALKALVRAGEWIALIAPPHVPYAPAFARHGIDPGRVIVVESAEEKNRWWSAEQVLRANSAGAMLFWPRAVNDAQTRRLQLAAQESQSLAFVFTGTARAAQPSPAEVPDALFRASADDAPVMLWLADTGWVCAVSIPACWSTLIEMMVGRGAEGFDKGLFVQVLQRHGATSAHRRDLASTANGKMNIVFGEASCR